MKYVLSVSDIKDNYLFPHRNKAKIINWDSMSEDKKILFVLLPDKFVNVYRPDDVLVVSGTVKTSKNGKVYLKIENPDDVALFKMNLNDYNLFVNTVLKKPEKYKKSEPDRVLKSFIEWRKEKETQKVEEKPQVEQKQEEKLEQKPQTEQRQEEKQESIEEKKAEKKEENQQKEGQEEEKEKKVNVIKTEEEAVRQELLRVRQELLKNTTQSRSILIDISISNLIAGDNVVGVIGGTGIGKTDTLLRTISAFYNQDEILYITCGAFTKLENLGIYPDINRMKEKGEVFYNKDVFLKKKVALFDELPNLTGEGGKVLSAVLSLFTPQRAITVDTEETKSNIQAIFWTGNFAPDLEEEEAKFGTLQIFDRTNAIYNVPEPTKEEIFEILSKTVDGVRYDRQKISSEDVILSAREMMRKQVEVYRLVLDDVANFLKEASANLPEVYRPSVRKAGGLISLAKAMSFLAGSNRVEPKVMYFLLKETLINPRVKNRIDADKLFLHLPAIDKAIAGNEEAKNYVIKVAKALADDLLLQDMGVSNKEAKNKKMKV